MYFSDILKRKKGFLMFIPETLPTGVVMCVLMNSEQRVGI